jgi:hypothetical protein
MVMYSTTGYILEKIDEFKQNVEDLYNMTLFSIKNK